ncbi:MAG: T9SS type A sorting domain-containing protein [Bacteroidales bacterium]|nr:T9SS type A sorting domain-containing protein [Bacteroidales bacterium]
MKKFLHSLMAVLILGFGTTYSQDIVLNGSFEQWEDDMPVGWYSLFNFLGYQNVFQSSDAQHGTSSVELKPLYNSTFQYVIPSFLSSEGFPVTSAHPSLKGYFKGSASGEDTLYITITMMSGLEYVGGGGFLTGATAASWTPFTVPIYYQEKVVPDSAFIYILAGSDAETATEGTDYLIDNLHFEASAGINDLKQIAEHTIFPNPVRSELNVRFTIEESDVLKFDLVSPQGKTVKTSGKTNFHPGQNTFTMQVSSLKPGMYFLYINGEKYRFNEKVLISD